MIAVDTSVLIRYLVNDDVVQAEAARELLEGLTRDQPAFVCREVIVEVVWVLERAYKFKRVEIAKVLVELAATDCLVVEAADDVTRAAFRYRKGGPGFAELMILAAANRAGLAPLYTFDKRLSKEEGANLIGTGTQ